MNWVVLEPEGLEVVDEFWYDIPCMGRFSADTNDGVTHVYFTTPTEIGWLIYADGRLSLDDAADRDVIDVIGTPGARNPGPPLFDPVRNVLVHYDMNSGQVAAHRYHGPGNLELLWQHALRNSVQMICWADTGELVVEDRPARPNPARPSADLVVLDIETGHERGRAPIGMGEVYRARDTKLDRDVALRIRKLLGR